MKAPTFKEETYGAPDDLVIELTRKQIEQMHEMANSFKDIDSFELRYNQNKLTFHFTLNFANEKTT